MMETARIVITVLALTALVVLAVRTRKITKAEDPAPRYARLLAAPGSVVLDLVDSEGEVVTSLVLTSIKRGLGKPATAVFTDRSHRLERDRA